MMMEQIPPMALLLELLPEDGNDADPAFIKAIGTEVATFLRDQGESVQPVYTGLRGGEVLFQIISAAWANKDIILSDFSSLVTVLTPVVLIAQHIKHTYGKHAGQEIAQKHPVTVTLEIKGITLTIETTDAKDAGTVATRLAQQILNQLSLTGDQTLIPQMTRIKANIPKQPTRKRR